MGDASIAPLSSCLETLPAACAMAAACAEALSLNDKAAAYSARARALRNEHSMTIPELGDLLTD